MYVGKQLLIYKQTWSNICIYWESFSCPIFTLPSALFCSPSLQRNISLFSRWKRHKIHHIVVNLTCVLFGAGQLA